jgi:hypothetical protein
MLCDLNHNRSPAAGSAVIDDFLDYKHIAFTLVSP